MVHKTNLNQWNPSISIRTIRRKGQLCDFELMLGELPNLSRVVLLTPKDQFDLDACTSSVWVRPKVHGFHYPQTEATPRLSWDIQTLFIATTGTYPNFP